MDRQGCATTVDDDRRSFALARTVSRELRATARANWLTAAADGKVDG